ncbi:probable serine/threonine-protein kinase samkC isoform X2 [Mya arenaria]|nr:probable serine/threonine-protein kinase samkC isoform X2 [Mya arenaria]
MRTLSYILENNQLPVLVRMSCDENHLLKMGTSHYNAGQFGNLLITEQYIEYYLMLNSVDGTAIDPEMRPEGNLMFLTENLSMTPVTGFKDRSQEDFQRYMAALAAQAAQYEYDTRRGNPDFAEYYARDINRKTGDGGIPTVNPPAIPGMDMDDQESEEELYEEMPPELPPRPPSHPESPISPTTDKHTSLHAVTVTDAGKTKNKPHGLRNLLKRDKPKESLIEDTSERSPKLGTELIIKPKTEKPASPTSKNLKRHKTLEKKDGPRGKPNDYQKTVYTAGTSKQATKPTNESNVSGGSGSTPVIPTRPKPSIPAVPKDGQYQTLAEGAPPPTYLHMKDESEESMYEVDPEPEVEQPEYCVAYQDMRGISRTPNKNQNQETKENPEVTPTTQARTSEVYEYMAATSQTGNEDMTSTKNIPMTSSSAGQRKGQQRTGKNTVPDTKHAKKNTAERNPAMPKNTKHSANNDNRADSQTNQTTPANVQSMDIGKLCDVLKQLKLDKYVQTFHDNAIDGMIVSSLKSEEYQTELGMTRLEALRLFHFVQSGHIPK